MTIELRIDIKFCVKLGKTAIETWKMLHEVYRDSCTSRARGFQRHKRFVEGREDDTKTGRSSTFNTDANIERVRQLVCSDRQLTIRTMAHELEIAKETIITILVEKLGMRKV